MTVATLLARTAMERLSGFGFRSVRQLHVAAGRFARVPAPSGVRPLRQPEEGNARAGADIYHGRWRLAGHTVECDPDGPFAERTAPADWMEALHGFGWLRDLAAGGGELQRVFGRGLVMDWITRDCRKHPPARRPRVEARRLSAWMTHASFLLHGAPDSFQGAFLAELGRAVRTLALIGPASDDPGERLTTAAAVANAAILLKGYEALRPAAFAQLLHDLERQILPDGGHVSRSPQRLVECLSAVVPVLSAADDLRIATPAPLAPTASRMATALRFLSHRDGGIAVFNGVSSTCARRVAGLLSALPASAALPHRLPQSGYIRFAHAGTTLIADCGLAPPAGANALAVAAPGAFEFSDGPERIVVNCGAPANAGREWTAAARATAACSTAVIGEASAGRLTRSRVVDRILGSPAITGFERCDAHVEETSEGSVLTLVHDGYAARFGCWHERRVFLSACGMDFRGEDSFHLQDGAPLPARAIRFHLHPDLSISAEGGLRLTTPDGRTWAFIARGGIVAIESSVYLPDGSTPRLTHQIVIRGAGQTRRVSWSFKRLNTATH